MPSAFRPASLLIETDLDHASLNPSEVLIDPAARSPGSSRIILHETLHYWQQLSQGFLFRMAAEDLARLEGFESDGTLAPPGPCRREYMRRYQPLGFSALDLQEALARYWDVHILGPPLLLSLERADPHRRESPELDARYAELERDGRLTAPDGSGYSGEAYNLAMAAAAGRYGKPYLLLLEQMPPMLAAGMFPLIAHIAFHASRPVPFFVRLLECALPLFGSTAEAEYDIEKMWTSCFAGAMALAHHLAGLLDEPFDVMPLLFEENEHLARASPYVWAQRRLRATVREVAQHEEVREHAAAIDEPPLQAAARELMLQLATPGIPRHRALLAFTLSPPVVQFAGGERWLLSDIVQDAGGRETPFAADLVSVADACAALDARWRAFARAGLRQGHAERAPGPPDYESAVYDGARAIARLGRNRDPILLGWLLELIRPRDPRMLDPFNAARGWHLFVRSTLAAQPARAEDVDYVCSMLAMHLGGWVPVAEYEVRTGITWSWGGSPMETALAAEYCAVAAEIRLGDTERARQCRAIELAALRSGAIARALALAPDAEQLGAALAARIERLETLAGDPGPAAQ